MRFKSSIYLTAFILIRLSPCSFALAQKQKESESHLIVLISGFGSDPSPEQLADKSPRGHGNSGMYQLAGDLTKAGFVTRFFNWNGTNAGQFTQKDAPGTDGIVSFIRERNSDRALKHLVIVGHSWGGHTLMEVADKLKEEPRIDLSSAIGIDPSSLGRGERIKELPATIQSFVNYHTRNSFVWGPWKDDKRVQNVDLGDPSSSFAAGNRRNYGAKFDVKAHTATEWDELIHADIIERIKSVVDIPESRSSSANDE